MHYYKLTLDFTFVSKNPLTEEQFEDIAGKQIDKFLFNLEKKNNVRESEKHQCCWGLSKLNRNNDQE